MENKDEGYFDFTINCAVYDFDINFVITSDLEKACEYINFKLFRDGDDRITTKYIDGHIGFAMIEEGHPPIVWLPKFPETAQEIGVAMHEIFHAIFDCMKWAEIPLTQDTEEAYCHLISYVTKNFFQNK